MENGLFNLFCLKGQEYQPVCYIPLIQKMNAKQVWSESSHRLKKQNKTSKVRAQICSDTVITEW